MSEVTIQTAQVSIRAVKVDGKAMTIALYEQLPVISSLLKVKRELKVLGFINRKRKSDFMSTVYYLCTINSEPYLVHSSDVSFSFESSSFEDPEVYNKLVSMLKLFVGVPQLYIAVG